MLRPIIVGTAIAGTLDILAAFVFAGAAGMSPARVLQFVASGPLGDRALTSPSYIAAGLIVHYAIMAVMVTVYMIVAPRITLTLRQPIVAGAAYGLLLWFVMYWVVRPMRWATLPHPTDPKAIAGQLFCHVILVGIPIALVAARHFGGRMHVVASPR